MATQHLAVSHKTTFKQENAATAATIKGFTSSFAFLLAPEGTPALNEGSSNHFPILDRTLLYRNRRTSTSADASYTFHIIFVKISPSDACNNHVTDVKKVQHVKPIFDWDDNELRLQRNFRKWVLCLWVMEVKSSRKRKAQTCMQTYKLESTPSFFSLWAFQQSQQSQHLHWLRHLGLAPHNALHANV